MARFGYHRPPGPREDEMANREGFGRDQEEPKPDYPQQRRQAVQEARKELDEAPSPEDFSSYPPLEASPAERFPTERDAASEALEDQQQQRLQKSMTGRVVSQGLRAAESVGIPLGMIAADQHQQTVKTAPDPITGRQTAREAGTLANQELAQNRREIKQWMKDTPGVTGHGTPDNNLDPWSKIPGGVAHPDPAQGKAIQEAHVGKARKANERAGELIEFFRGWDEKLPDADSLVEWKEGRAKWNKRWKETQQQYQKARQSMHDNPAYNKWAAATAKAMDKSQELKNLSAMASDLMTGVSKAAGGISGGMALFGIVTGGLMVGHEVLKELGDADDTAIPKTLRFIAQNQGVPLYDYHVAPEAAAQLTPQDIEELYQDGTLSHEFYTQLKGR